MHELLLVLAKVMGIGTAAEFVVAMRLYFRSAGVRSKGNAAWTVVAITSVTLHVVLLLAADSTPFPMLLIGMVCFLLANWLFWTAVASHGNQRPGVVFGPAVPEKLTVCGPYKVVRHPFYLAYVLSFLGSSCVGLHWVQFVTTGLLFLCYNHAAAGEERMLTSDPSGLHAEYARYAKRTWRWLPLIW
jgi:protein-S-isoprenylcysteine O-methyltransferase Ste14